MLPSSLLSLPPLVGACLMNTPRSNCVLILGAFLLHHSSKLHYLDVALRALRDQDPVPLIALASRLAEVCCRDPPRVSVHSRVAAMQCSCLHENNTHIYIYIQMCIYVYVYIYIRVCVCRHIHIYIYIYTYIYIYIHIEDACGGSSPHPLQHAYMLDLYINIYIYIFPKNMICHVTWHLGVSWCMRNTATVSENDLCTLLKNQISNTNACSVIYIYIYIYIHIYVHTYPGSISSSRKSPRAAKHTIRCASRLEYVCCKFQQNL